MPQHALLLLFLAALAAGARGVEAQEAVLRPAGEIARPTGGIAFDIPAQALAPALDTFSALSGLEVLYDSDLAARRRSAGVQGIFRAGEALRLVLRGSGLSARTIAPDAVTLTPAPEAEAPTPQSGRYAGYFGMIQVSFEQAFCQVNELRPGDYRGLLEFWIGPSGEVRRPRLVRSTGEGKRDQAIAERVEQLVLAGPPPPDLPQPIMMLILPRSSGLAPNCAAAKPKP